jgi:hypothetical protein
MGFDGALSVGESGEMAEGSLRRNKGGLRWGGGVGETVPKSLSLSIIPGGWHPFRLAIEG